MTITVTVRGCPTDNHLIKIYESFELLRDKVYYVGFGFDENMRASIETIAWNDSSLFVRRWLVGGDVRKNVRNRCKIEKHVVLKLMYLLLTDR